jgi:hypothetical protein
MARTNKQGIAAKKAQQAKQGKRSKGLKRFEYPKRALSVDEGKELGVIGVQTNPKGASYHWFLGGRKICYETKMRIDPDGYRFVRLPSGGSDYVSVGMSWWARKKAIKSMKFKK